MTNKTTIKCPNCGFEIDINEALYHQLESKHRQEWLAEKKKQEAEIEAKRKEYKAHLDTLKAQEEALAEQKERFEDSVRKATTEQLRVDRLKMQESIKQEVIAEQSGALESMRKELAAKSEQVKELNNSKIEIEKLKREKEEAVSRAMVEAQLTLTKELSIEKEKIAKQYQDANELKLKEKDKQLEDQKRLIEEMKRKADQGSMQLQGEVQELAIEEWLSMQFPFDTIGEIKKGAFGADCVQVVHTREAQNCGVICYESKNTKAWSSDWVHKLKTDMLKAGADIGVLVTSVYPKDMDRMGFVDGVWVCSLDEFKGSVSLMRQSLINTHKAVQKEDNKADKMSLLYNYLTGNEFAMQLSAIVNGFSVMQDELEREKRSLMASWKRRQKLIDGVLANTTEMYGSLQGIAGNAIGHIKALELPDINEDE
ncbi:MAG: DUF2130 domain-containing protein [Sulfurovaceae bacterium]|nr:DUF2130 domain-containing protein [Sulfurovaceae bacterium]